MPIVGSFVSRIKYMQLQILKVADGLSVFLWFMSQPIEWSHY